MFEAFAVAAPGLEEIVAGELVGLGIKEPRVIEGGVEFTASQKALYEANLQLRTASRVLVRLATGFRAVSFAELERNARDVPWKRVLKRGDRVALRVTCRKSRLYHSGAVAQRIERDLVERIGAVVSKAPASDDGDENRSELRAQRPEADADNTQLIVVRLDHDKCTISADSSGAHLHQRGYRTAVTTAPLRETLAAALILGSGWDTRTPLLDPFCGSGTIPIEAAMIAARMAPGRNREFRFMHWPRYDAAEWKRLHSAALSRQQSRSVPLIVGTDRSAAAIRASEDNAQRAGVAKLVRFGQEDALNLDGGETAGWVVTNPPYGVRLGDSSESRRLLARFGDALESRFAGWHVALLAPAQLQRAMGIPLQPAFRTTNGGLRVQLLAGMVANGQAQSSV